MWANVADLECRSLSLPASCDLGIDRRQLHRISIRAQPGPARARIAPVSLRVDPGAVLPSGGLRRRGVDAERLPAFWHLYVFAWRLAASHSEHVDSVVVRSAHRGSAGSHEVSRVLFCLRRGRGGDPCGLQRSVHRSRPWRFGSNRWRARMLHAPVSLRAPGRRETTGTARSLAISERHRSPSTLQDVHPRRIATGAISAFARTQRWRRYFFARALGKPNLPCRPPGTLGVWCLCLPGDRI